MTLGRNKLLDIKLHKLNGRKNESNDDSRVDIDGDNLESHSTTYCKEKWTKRGELNKRMFDHCRKKAKEAHQGIEQFRKEFSGKSWFGKIAEPNCFKKWTKRDVIDFNMVEHCLKGEKEGVLDLKYAIKEGKGKLAEGCYQKRKTWDTPFSSAAYCVKKTRSKPANTNELTNVLNE